MFEEAVEIRDRLAVLVDRLDPDAFSGATARELWAVLDKSERLCAAGKTLLARRLAQTHRPQLQGTKTAAEDLAKKSGTSTGAAKESLDTSQRLPDQPSVDGALRRGELSPVQAALISAAAAADPSAEARLVDLASQVSLAELREECAATPTPKDSGPCTPKAPHKPAPPSTPSWTRSSTASSATPAARAGTNLWRPTASTR